jgi:hypothetical protein
MRNLTVITAIAAVLLAIAAAGCGGSSKAQQQASARQCWTSAYRSEIARRYPSGKQFAARFTKNIGNVPPRLTAELAQSVDAVTVTNARLLLTSVQAYAANATLPGWLPGYIPPWLHATKQKCGRLS